MSKLFDEVIEFFQHWQKWIFYDSSFTYCANNPDIKRQVL